ncbi:MAG TPA: maleylpyruvate isomerase family mycothiol-dependent enzyme [Actinomycetota bacterium]|jgi:uncharacterized protein (TIGR03083 family)|nr:maleylpyruvate isomerase family mycothiol-dependent enzyme [Actinomycetota bacterium]
MADIDASTYLEHIKRDGLRIPDVAEGNFEKAVPTCPGNTVESLLMHTGTLYVFWSEAIRQDRRPQIDWSVLNSDLLAANRQGVASFLECLQSRDPDEVVWTWAQLVPGGPKNTLRFWYRRAAQELSVHRWDFENAVGAPSGIDPELAMDGVDELLVAFGPATGMEAYRGASERFAGDGETFKLEPTDGPDPITFTARPDRFELNSSAEPNVTARGAASDLLLFVWGRVPPSALEVSGDASLLQRWQERVKI